MTTGERGFEIVSSLAGRVRAPVLPAGAVRIGGFGGIDGLRNWLADNDIHAVVDATHPFAGTMSGHAAAGAPGARGPRRRASRRDADRHRPRGDRRALLHLVRGAAKGGGTVTFPRAHAS
ncbi:precorrin-6A/cobalt-precorrin-6A reductase, partial [Nocardia wallacei]|uniref:precorrin-6A/cobalt-precorrin-6A reductase n=1 Tax=Nocardia wallacei TaxID=480035 RepID=UPI003CC7D9D8